MSKQDSAQVIQFPSIEEVRRSVDQLTKGLEEGVQDLGGRIEESINTLRKRGGKQTDKLVAGIEEDLKGYVEALFKRFRFPVRADLNSLKRRLTAIEKRLEAIEKAREAA